ncbi:MAG: Hsp20/alpha crystallin family protein [Candidatus Thermoplasmatota archaeon]
MADEEKKEGKDEEEDRRLAERKEDWFFSPFREMDSIFEDLDRTLDRFFGRPVEGRTSSRMMPQARTPVTDLRDLGDKYRVEAEMPGLDKDDIEIEVRKDGMVIEAEKEKEIEEEGEDYLRSERGYRSFYRKLPLPDEVNVDEVGANLENGILTIDLPKKEPEEKEGRKIEIE